MYDNDLKLMQALSKLKAIIGTNNFYYRALKVIVFYRVVKYPELSGFSDSEALYRCGHIREYYKSDGIIHIQDCHLVYFLIDEKYANLKLQNSKKELKLYDGVASDLDEILLDREKVNKIINCLNEIDSIYYFNLVHRLIGYLIFLSKNDVSLSKNYISDSALTDISIDLLDLESNSVLLDPICGYTTLPFNLKKSIELYLMDCRPSSIFVNKLLCILLNRNNVKLYRGSKDMKENFKINKIFCDTILYSKSKSKNANIQDDISVISKVLDYADTNGDVVITVSDRLLVSNLEYYIKSRKILNYFGIRMVITLPSFLDKTKTGTHLLLLERNYRGDITFIDGSSIKYVGDDYISLIRVIKKAKCNEFIDEISIKISQSELLKDENLSLSPARYLKNNYLKLPRKSESIDKIDHELQHLYAKLEKVMSSK